METTYNTDAGAPDGAHGSVPRPAQRRPGPDLDAPKTKGFPRRRRPAPADDPRRGDRRKGDRRTRSGGPPPGMAERRKASRRRRQRRRRRGIAVCVALLALCFAAPESSLANHGRCIDGLRTPVALSFHGRSREAAQLSLVTCDGEPNQAILDRFSVLMRPRGTHVDAPPSDNHEHVAEGIARFDPRLLQRLQAIADHFPGHAIEVVSGYRAGARVGSRHHHAEALDIRVEGVHRARVAAFARTLPETGVGFYPHSTFTHVDVRRRSSFWVDESQPGQRSRYAPEAEEDERLRVALAELDGEQNLVAAASTAIRDVIASRTQNGPFVASTRPAAAPPEPAPRPAVAPSVPEESAQVFADAGVPDLGIAEVGTVSTVGVRAADAGIRDACPTEASVTAPAEPIDWAPPW
ncbi:MAG: DUF882 domain-containing protein [Myxococcota bacterium]